MIVTVTLSTDASEPDVAALEASTFAAPLRSAPGRGDDSTHSSRAALAAFLNGPTGRDDRQRQGLQPALGRAPHHMGARRAARVTEVAAVEDLAAAGRVTGPGGSHWTASGPVVNCPILALG